MENSINAGMNGSTLNASKLSVSYNTSYAAMSSNTTGATSKTPNKDAACSKKKTPNEKKSSGKDPEKIQR